MAIWQDRLFGLFRKKIKLESETKENSNRREEERRGGESGNMWRMQGTQVIINTMILLSAHYIPWLICSWLSWLNHHTVQCTCTVSLTLAWQGREGEGHLTLMYQDVRLWQQISLKRNKNGSLIFLILRKGSLKNTLHHLLLLSFFSGPLAFPHRLTPRAAKLEVEGKGRRPLLLIKS